MEKQKIVLTPEQEKDFYAYRESLWENIVAGGETLLSVAIVNNGNAMVNPTLNMSNEDFEYMQVLNASSALLDTIHNVISGLSNDAKMKYFERLKPVFEKRYEASRETFLHYWHMDH